jgi:hypothetical protein
MPINSKSSTITAAIATIAATATTFSDLSKEVMTIKAQLLVLVIRLDYVEKKLMRK